MSTVNVLPYTIHIIVAADKIAEGMGIPKVHRATATVTKFQHPWYSVEFSTTDKTIRNLVEFEYGKPEPPKCNTGCNSIW